MLLIHTRLVRIALHLLLEVERVARLGAATAEAAPNPVAAASNERSLPIIEAAGDEG